MQPGGAGPSFGDVLRRALATKNKQKWKDAAAALDMTERAFHTKMRGESRFDPDQIAVLIAVIGDERLPRWFFTGTDLLLVKRPSQGGGALTMRERTVTCMAETLGAIACVADALDLAMRGERRPADLVDHLDRAQGGLWSIRLHLTPLSASAAVAPAQEAPEGFASLVRRALRKDHGITLQALSSDLNLKYNALNGRMSGRVGFTPAELRLMFLKFPDPRLANYLLSKSSYLAARRPRSFGGDDRGHPAQLALHSMRQLLKLLEQLLVAGEMNTAISEAVDRHLTEAVRLLALLRWRVTHIGRSGAATDWRPSAVPPEVEKVPVGAAPARAHARQEF
jgi:hypothetical protein